MSSKSLELKQEEDWTLIIKPRSGWLQLHLSDLWRYRDLLFLFVKRDFVAVYKQTILGPAWFFIQPILTTIMFTIVFGKIAKIGTDGMPQIVFYLSGVTVWSYFAECINKTSNTFLANANIFGKVYFPRLIMPMSIIVSNLIKFGIQFLLFIIILLYYKFVIGEDAIQPKWQMLLLPVYIFMLGALGLGLGLIISSLTTKYRDLTHLVKFGVQLFMYATPIVYPMSVLLDKPISDTPWIADSVRIFIQANPLTAIVENFRYSFLGAGEFQPTLMIYSMGIIAVIFFIGMVVFNKIERSFMDTV